MSLAPPHLVVYSDSAATFEAIQAHARANRYRIYGPYGLYLSTSWSIPPGSSTKGPLFTHDVALSVKL
jgi:hypothetical protein